MRLFFFLFVLALPDEIVRQDFLEEIQLMKAVGSHKNIVNMVGCCTVEEPMFLLVEYAPYGDLLHYLRKHRKTVFVLCTLSIYLSFGEALCYSAGRGVDTLLVERHNSRMFNTVFLINFVEPSHI